MLAHSSTYDVIDSPCVPVGIDRTKSPARGALKRSPFERYIIHFYTFTNFFISTNLLWYQCKIVFQLIFRSGHMSTGMSPTSRSVVNLTQPLTKDLIALCNNVRKTLSFRGNIFILYKHDIKIKDILIVNFMLVVVFYFVSCKVWEAGLVCLQHSIKPV